MRRTAIQTGGMSSIKSNDPLGGAFDVLPVDKKLLALQGGYGSMAKEFEGLVNKVPDEFVTIKRPVSISQQLVEKYPLLTVEQKDSEEKNTSDSTSNDTSSSNSNDTSSSSEGSIKKISF